MHADKLNTKQVKHIQKPCHSPADLGIAMKSQQFSHCDGLCSS